MHRANRTALILAVGEAVALVSSVSAFAQTPAQPVASGSPLAEALREQPGKATDAPPSSSAERRASAGPTGGYSWRSKPPHKVRHEKQRPDPTRPQAKGPEFRVAPDGTSHISVQLSQRVEVSVSAHANTYIYDLPNAQVVVPNDRNPLVTTHFATPVSRIKLISQGKSARLIVELRQPTVPQFQVRQLPNGAAVFEISLPKQSVTTLSPSGTVKHRASHKGKRRD